MTWALCLQPPRARRWPPLAPARSLAAPPGPAPTWVAGSPTMVRRLGCASSAAISATTAATILSLLKASPTTYRRARAPLAISAPMPRPRAPLARLTPTWAPRVSPLAGLARRGISAWRARRPATTQRPRAPRAPLLAPPLPAPRAQRASLVRGGKHLAPAARLGVLAPRRAHPAAKSALRAHLVPAARRTARVALRGASAPLARHPARAARRGALARPGTQPAPPAPRGQARGLDRRSAPAAKREGSVAAARNRAPRARRGPIAAGWARLPVQCALEENLAPAAPPLVLAARRGNTVLRARQGVAARAQRVPMHLSPLPACHARRALSAARQMEPPVAKVAR